MNTNKVKDILIKIIDWEFPETGKIWDDGTPMSYGAVFGTNGERDYMRNKALEAFNLLVIEEQRLPKIRDLVAFKMRNSNGWKLVEWGEGWDEELPPTGFIEKFIILE